jgi:hypothetical protein
MAEEGVGYTLIQRVGWVIEKGGKIYTGGIQYQGGSGCDQLNRSARHLATFCHRLPHWLRFSSAQASPGGTLSLPHCLDVVYTTALCILSDADGHLYMYGLCNHFAHLLQNSNRLVL